MSDTTQTTIKSHSAFGVIVEILKSQYGPYAFGFIALYATWILIIKPELASRELKTHELEQVAIVVRDASVANRETAIILKATSDQLQRTVELLARNTQ